MQKYAFKWTSWLARGSNDLGRTEPNGPGHICLFLPQSPWVGAELKVTSSAPYDTKP